IFRFTFPAADGIRNLYVTGVQTCALPIFTLPAASLEDSLNVLSRQSGAQILVDQNLVRGKKARAIKGASSVEVALIQLLHGTDQIGRASCRDRVLTTRIIDSRKKEHRISS